MTGTSPFEKLLSNEVERLYIYKANEFPDVLDLPCGEIIKQCWLCKVGSTKQVCDSIKAISTVTASL